MSEYHIESWNILSWKGLTASSALGWTNQRISAAPQMPCPPGSFTIFVALLWMLSNSFMSFFIVAPNLSPVLEMTPHSTEQRGQSFPSLVEVLGLMHPSYDWPFQLPGTVLTQIQLAFIENPISFWGGPKPTFFGIQQQFKKQKFRCFTYTNVHLSKLFSGQ